MCPCSAIHLDIEQRYVFKFIRIIVDSEIIVNDTKTIVCIENIYSFQGVNAVFKFGLLWTMPKRNYIKMSFEDYSYSFLMLVT